MRSPRVTRSRFAVALTVALPVLLTAAIVPASPPPVPCQPTDAITLSPPPSGVYHGAFPSFSHGESDEDYVRVGRIARFERLVGKRIVWAYFANHWYRAIRFPATQVRAIWQHGAVPFMRMMPWRRTEQNRPSVGYRLQSVIDGAFDVQLAAWARDAKATGIPLMVEFGPEVNGEWFPWNGRWQGGGRSDRYGDPNLPDGPERFRDAYRRIVGLVRAQGARNITWVFHANPDSVPDAGWNRISAYYPGDDYVDWIGVSAYGATAPGEPLEPFASVLGVAYDELAGLSSTKPLAVLEFGVPERPDRTKKARWISAAFRTIRQGRFPRIRAVSWWAERWRDEGEFVDLDPASSKRSLRAYRRAVADPFSVAQPTFGCEA